MKLFTCVFGGKYFSTCQILKHFAGIKNLSKKNSYYFWGGYVGILKFDIVYSKNIHFLCLFSGKIWPKNSTIWLKKYGVGGEKN